MNRARESFGWLDIVRLGFVQAALGAVVVLVTSTLNRVMIIEYSMPAMLPGILVAVQYAVQMIRPRFGHGSDVGGRCSPWIVGGIAVLAVGGILCSIATIMIARHPITGIICALMAYAIVGLGVGAAGTSLLVLMAKRVDDTRRAAAATIMWVLMIAGFAITSTAVGHVLDPFSPQRLILVTAVVAGAALIVSMLAVWRVEGAASIQVPTARSDHSFRQAVRQIWSEPAARRFTLFVFVSMLAYSAQELILEPFSGLIFGYSVGESARLSGLQHAAVFLGMITVGLACSGGRRGGARRIGSLQQWTVGGCLASAAALAGLAIAAWVGPAWPLRGSVFFLGFANGTFAVAAIGSMMQLAGQGGAQHAGVRMGLWGAAQAIAFALGGLFGSMVVDSVRFLLGSPLAAYLMVFSVEAILFAVAARFATRIDSLTVPGPTAHTRVVTV